MTFTGSTRNTKPQNRTTVMARPKAQDLPGVEGEGVAPIKDKKLEQLGDEFIEIRDKKAELATELTGIETKILDRMREKGIEVFRFGDQEMKLKPGKTHVKVKTIKSEPEDGSDTSTE